MSGEDDTKRMKDLASHLQFAANAFNIAFAETKAAGLKVSVSVSPEIGRNNRQGDDRGITIRTIYRRREDEVFFEQERQELID